MLICSITGCTEEEAQKAMDVTEDAVAAIDLIMPTGEVPSGGKYILPPKSLCKREKTEAEETLGEIRRTMENLDAEVEYKRLTSNRIADLPPSETHTLHEGTALQSNCVQQCLLPSVEEEVETPETESQ